MSFARKIDFNSLMEPVALRLLGEPAQKLGSEWRYGSRGSLVIDLKKGSWFDHEANVGGGVFDLIRRQGYDQPAAWLRSEGLLGSPFSRTDPKIVKTYDYLDEIGELLFQVVRFEPKDFKQRRPDGRGGWIWKLGDTRRVPYLLPELVKAVAAGETIYIPEGEKDVDSLRAIGRAATTNPGGIKKDDRVKGGLSSGEGLINEVRDERKAWNKKECREEVVDAGVKDKRLMVVEPEFASALAVAERHGNTLHDLYETPSVAVEALLRVLALPRGAIWEPACGRGAIANVLRAHGHRVVCTDLVDYGTDPTAIYGVDFLKTTELPDGVSCIVTNPPYMLANELTAHALELCRNVVMLLRLAFLESERRSPILDGAGLRRVFVFRKRLPMMHREGWQGRKASSGLAFAWFVWECGYRGDPVTQRISWEDGRDAAPLLLPHGRPTKGSRAGSQIKRGANRAYVLARLRRDGRADLIEKVESGALSVRGALAAMTDKQTS